MTRGPVRSRRMKTLVDNKRLLGIAAGGAALGAFAIRLVVRGCGGSRKVDAIEARLSRIESVLRLSDAGPAPAARATGSNATPGGGASGATGASEGGGAVGGTAGAAPLVA